MEETEYKDSFQKLEELNSAVLKLNSEFDETIKQNKCLFDQHDTLMWLWRKNIRTKFKILFLAIVLYSLNVISYRYYHHNEFFHCTGLVSYFAIIFLGVIPDRGRYKQRSNKVLKEASSNCTKLVEINTEMDNIIKEAKKLLED